MVASVRRTPSGNVRVLVEEITGGTTVTLLDGFVERPRDSASLGEVADSQRPVKATSRGRRDRRRRGSARVRTHQSTSSIRWARSLGVAAGGLSIPPGVPATELELFQQEGRGGGLLRDYSLVAGVIPIATHADSLTLGPAQPPSRPAVDAG